MRIAYFVNQYPKVSHSFIRREILALERQGFDIQRIALRGWDDGLVDPEDMRERDLTRYVLKGGMGGLVAATWKVLCASPARFLSALLLALKMGVRADRPLPFHVIYLAEACQMVAWLQTEKAEHLHAHFGTNSAEVAMLAHVLCGLPYSFTVHGPEEFDKPEFIGLGEKIRRAAFVVAISSFGRSQLYRWVEHAHWSKIQVVHCGLESAFHNVPRIPITDRPCLVCVGRLCEQKGQLMLIEAAAALHRDGIDFELVLAGDGEMRREIEAKIAQRGLQSKVRITGWISSAQVREEIQAAKAMVLPSFGEGLPVVIMEAMALHRPVLTTYIAGIPELVLHGVNGWLFPAGDIQALSAVLKQCLATPLSTLEEMGNAGYQRVLERHSIDTEVAKLAKLFSPHKQVVAVQLDDAYVAA